jgi:hypothetical protein
LADNKIAANAGTDYQRLAEELSDLANVLPEFNLDLEITAYEMPEIDSIFENHRDREVDPADDIPSPQQRAISKLGNLWQLEPHRLLCGDAQSAKHEATHMGSDSAAMVFTDPPYNVRTSRIQGRGRSKYGDFIQASGEMSPREFTRFLQGSLSNAVKRCKGWRDHLRVHGLAAYGRTARGRRRQPGFT